MEIQYLTPDQLKSLDPYGNNSAVMSKFKNVITAFNEPPSRFFRLSPNEMLGRYQEMLEKFRLTTKGKHESYFEYNQEMMSKFAPQGGMYTWDKMMQLLSEYYVLAERPISIIPQLKRGRDYLLALIRERVARFGLAQPVQTKYYSTFAGLPTGMKKGTYQAETEMFGNWIHVLPTCLGQRRMRAKDRLIFQDSVVNVRYVESLLGAVRNWFKQYIPELFAGWIRPDYELTPRITKILNRPFSSIETDYNGMDMHFSLSIVQELILPVYELLLTPGEYLHLAHYVSEMFYQEVFAGNFLITGLHNLFSGVCPTNDFETIFTVEQSCGAVLSVGETPLQDDVLIVANGDDAAIVINRKRFSDSKIRDIHDASVSMCNAAGVEMSLEKCRISNTDVRFCRSVYYPSGRRDINGCLLGAYPSVLALNAIVQPEKSLKSDGYAAIADLQRLDNCAGSPEFTQFVQFVYKRACHKFRFTEKDLDTHPVDWWYRLYGERWDPASSPSFNLIHKSMR